MITDRAIILCGFMGCGKNTVGTVLARQLNREFLDTDRVIEQQAGMSVSEIFASRGEPEFRAMEREVCRRLAQKKDCVVATGGGALTFPENARSFREAGCPVVLLDVPLRVILRRLQNDTTRPLLQQPDKEQAARQLFDRRLPVYRAAATLTVDGNRSPAQTAREIVQRLESSCAAAQEIPEIRF